MVTEHSVMYFLSTKDRKSEELPPASPSIYELVSWSPKL